MNPTHPIARLKIPSPHGPLEIGADDRGVVRVKWTPQARNCDGSATANETCQRAAEQLTAYLVGDLKEFDLPLTPSGSEFQQRIWRALAQIPYGRTRTYGEIAALCGRPKGAQAVGAACGANPIPLIIPCHRVLAAGHLGGFAYGLKTKRWLLELEKARQVQRSLFDLEDRAAEL